MSDIQSVPRVCLKNYFCNLHVLLCGIHPTESSFKTLYKKATANETENKNRSRQSDCQRKMEDLEMNEVIEILKEIDDSIDYENEKALIDDQLLDSFGVITLVSELEEAFDISIEASEMMPENFNSAEAIWKMVQRLQED